MSISGLDLSDVLKRAHEANRSLNIGQRYKWVYQCQLHTAGAWVAQRYPGRCLCATATLLSLREAEAFISGMTENSTASSVNLPSFSLISDDLKLLCHLIDAINVESPVCVLDENGLHFRMMDKEHIQLLDIVMLKSFFYRYQVFRPIALTFKPKDILRGLSSSFRSKSGHKSRILRAPVHITVLDHRIICFVDGYPDGYDFTVEGGIVDMPELPSNIVASYQAQVPYLTKELLLVLKTMMQINDVAKFEAYDSVFQVSIHDFDDELLYKSHYYGNLHVEGEVKNHYRLSPFVPVLDALSDYSPSLEFGSGPLHLSCRLDKYGILVGYWQAPAKIRAWLMNILWRMRWLN